jgi:hypothetical protein
MGLFRPVTGQLYFYIVKRKGCIIRNNSDDSHKKALFTGGAISPAARTELQTKKRKFYAALKNKFLRWKKKKHQTTLYSQLTKH